MKNKIVTATKYQLWENRTALKVFYSVMIVIYTLNLLVCVLFDGSSNSSGQEFISDIFLFVAGISTFGMELRLYLQCGLDRKTLSISLFLSLLVLSAIMLACDTVLWSLFRVLSNALEIDYGPSVAAMLFPEAGLPMQLLLHFCALTAASYVGLLIAAVFQQIPRKLRWAYCVALPVCSLVLFIYAVESTAGKTLIDLLVGGPWVTVLVLIIVTAVCAGVSHLLTMRSYLR